MSLMESAATIGQHRAGQFEKEYRMEDQPRARRRVEFASLGLALLSLSGCAHIPPAALQATATEYNIVLQRTGAEQLLLNLVRLRYHEPPFFMQPGAVSAQLRRTVDLTAQAGIKDANVTEHNLGLDGHLGFSEQPTLTFVPLQGEAFMGRMLSRLDLQTLLLLYHSGWDIERVFRLCVHSLNEIINSPSAAGVRGAQREPHDSFDAVMDLLQALQRAGAIDFGYAPASDPPAAVISLPATDTNPTVQAFRKRLRLAPGRSEYRLELGTRAEAKDSAGLVIATRSLMGILFSLSHSVEVPEGDLQRAVVTVTRDATTAPFHVRVSATPPAMDSIRTYYRGHWFFIDDTDLESKSTMILLSQLFSIQSGPTNSFAPVLTLPAGSAP